MSDTFPAMLFVAIAGCPSEQNRLSALASRLEKTSITEITERLICRKLLDTIVAKGFCFIVNDGEENVTKRITDVDVGMAAMFSTDADVIKIFPISESPLSEKLPRLGSVSLIYGNGSDVISDYSLSVEDIIQPANLFADTLA